MNDFALAKYPQDEGNAELARNIARRGGPCQVKNRPAQSDFVEKKEESRGKLGERQGGGAPGPWRATAVAPLAGSPTPTVRAPRNSRRHREQDPTEKRRLAAVRV